MRIRSVLAILLLASTPATPVVAQTPPHVKVNVEFRQTARSSRDAVEGRGGVIVTERRTRTRGSVDIDSTNTKSRQTTGVFTIVQSGGEATITIAQQIPFNEVAFYQRYATGEGHATSALVFRDVGTSLKVRAVVQPDRQIALRVTPVISYFSGDGSGTIEFTRASTDIVVRHGQPVVIAGGTTESNAVTRRILGLSDTKQSGETMVVLTATLQ